MIEFQSADAVICYSAWSILICQPKDLALPSIADTGIQPDNYHAHSNRIVSQQCIEIFA